ncbi:GRB10-interacting GYF protein 2 [Xenopus laevis]|uniref:GRB10-interacting GYF protein 2 n=1 Tax=Xenopus laevis TaxID=8355 RepID=GGYF2_XENLA|nr:GRB10-interacting GYF protein 2 [Xenopus laevis]Q5U236.1 RecName: Full=GRB10-interacting GYF protein 2; AltName: Full=PERQ amino acid-rich with GYF domain-containing protein 2 [Xenopus laevis]AAH86295.1 LOC495698 protein [Xenopus laevis]
MTAETQTLNFGPEWLRALSSGGSVISPPLSPALPKYKLADFRYGREEMLALYVKDNKVPSDLLDKEFLPILNDEPLLPLALVSFTEEEQRNFSMSVNSAAVLRLTNRGSSGGGGTVVGVPRGRSSSRGRGRGRGESGFYQRSFDEVESGFGRGAREMHRSQSWEERGDRRFEKPARKEPDGVRGSAWREIPDRRRRFDYDLRESKDERGYRRPRSGSGIAEDERDSLPEWCLDDAEDETGTFDSSGAFLSSKPSKKVQKEPIPEEQEIDFHPSVDGAEVSDSDGSQTEEAKETDPVQSQNQDDDLSRNDHTVQAAPSPDHKTSSPVRRTDMTLDTAHQKAVSPHLSCKMDAKSQSPSSPPTPSKHKEDAASASHQGTREKAGPCLPHPQSPALSQRSPARQPDPHIVPAMSSVPVPQLDTPTVPIHSSVCAAPGMEPVPPEPDEDGLEHLEQQAQQMVAYLQDGTLDDDHLLTKVLDQRVKGPSLDNQQKWYYKDPQGEIQGPFSNREMAEWYQAGYFPMTLLLRRVCDETFQPLGDIFKKWGRVPFSTPPTPRLGDLDPERLSRQQEITALYQMRHLHYQQLLFQQQYAVLAQQQKVALSSQQQQLPLPLQPLSMRIPEHTVIPPVVRALSVPESTSLWELPPAPTQPAVWEGSSVWDLPVEPTTQGTTREQLAQMDKVKAAKMEQERREAELRAKQEEEEQHRRKEAEEERKRREEEELARRKQEEALQRQKELALQKQMEEEERQRKKELQLLEERMRQEEERKRLEEERRRQEEERRKQLEERKRAEEERRRREEEKKREEDERRQLEEIQRKQEEAARWAREEEEAVRLLLEEARLKAEEEERNKREEAQRQKELQRQRQQQQEALRRLQLQQQQQQLAQMKLPSSSTWGQQVTPSAASQSALSLAEIQKLEEERERQKLQEQRHQQQELKALQQQQQQQQQKIPGWGTMSKPTGTTKSLLEIQQEEAGQMQKNHQQPGRNRPANISLPVAPVVNNHISSPTVGNSGSSVWGSLNNNLSPQWSSDSMSSIWGSTDVKGSSVGFWDDAVKEVAPRNATSKNKNNASKSAGSNSRQSKKVEQEEKLLRLFQGANKCQDDFTQWCEKTMHAINTAHSLDVPTFVSFLREVESPYEVHDYVCAYLGDTPEAKDFSKQFIERRTKQKTSQHRPQQDVAWVTCQTSQANSQPITLEAVQCAGRKKKKQKMVRADPSLLGFSVNASSERLNMGEIETAEDY